MKRVWAAPIAWVTALAAALAASLALARVHPFGDAGLYAVRPGESRLFNQAGVPPAVRAMIETKCADCHSDRTRAPLYGRFAPVSWLLERDVINGREAMNLSRWESYSEAQQQTLEVKIAQETRAHKMPLAQYRMIHWNARVNDSEVRMLANWAHAVSGAEAAATEPSSGEGDPARGKALFEKRCTGCHALTVNKQGPQLQGVYGRPSGTAPGYAYSDALAKARIVWDDKSLDKWLTDPDVFIPGNNMDFLVTRPQERLDLISYLRQASGK